MKFLKNKTVLGIVSILVGILVCFVFAPIYNKSLEAKTSVIRVEKNIEKGQVITSGDIKLVEIGSYNLSDKVIRTPEEVVGTYAVTDMFSGELIIPERISKKSLYQDYLENFDGNRGAISITLPSFAAGLSNKLLPGDIVSVLVTDSTTKDTMIPKELRYVKVLAVTTKEGKDIDETTINKQEAEEIVAVTITLLVEQKQAILLANFEELNKIHLQLVYRGLEKDAKEFLEIQRTILESIEESSMEVEKGIQEEDIVTDTEEENLEIEGDENE